MRAFLFPIVLAVAGCSASSETASGSVVPSTGSTGTDRHFPATGFDSIGLSGSGDVDIRIGPSFSVTAAGTSADLDQLEVKQDGRSLSLGFKSGFHGNIGSIRWRVTLPHIVATSIGGSGTIMIDRVDGPAFDGSIGGSGDVRIGAMHVSKAQFSIGGSGRITAAGVTKALDLSSGGAGRFALNALRAETASISLAGSGTVAGTVTGHADISVVGSGDVTLSGGATCSITNVGSGQVHCR